MSECAKAHLQFQNLSGEDPGPSAFRGGERKEEREKGLDWGGALTYLPLGHLGLALPFDLRKNLAYGKKCKILCANVQKSFSYWDTSCPRPPTGALPLDHNGGLQIPQLP